MDEILTVGITTYGNKVANNVINFLKGQKIKVIISENKEDCSNNLPSYIEELKRSGVDTKYFFCAKQGIAYNRQNILDNVNTKYFYTIDNDDGLTGNFTKVNEFLSKAEYDAVFIRCYEDGKYMRIPSSFIYMCTWMQIYRTEWIRSLGGYVQSWNFIHEESATNINWRTNLKNRKYRRIIIPKSYLSYKYHANSVCLISFDVSKVCDFIKGIPTNEKIIYKKKFLQLFTNFVKKYIQVYRVNENKNITYIDNFKNGKYEDILQSLNDVKSLLSEKRGS